MNSVVNQDERNRRHLVVTVKQALRDVRSEISSLNHQVGGKAELKDGDLDCLDLISRHGPLTPSALSRRSGLHPATMTGILDRLELGGWIARERDQNDRRAVLLRAVPEKNAELFALYSGMDGELDTVCAQYSVAELEVIADFLRKSADAGTRSAASLAARP